jgi:hypothetical protein
MTPRCNKCGSYAFNLHNDGIKQGDLCDVHYWQDRAESLPRSAIVQSIWEFALNPYHRCDVAYKIICAHQYDWGEWDNSFYGDKEERMQGRVFCLIVAEAFL